MSKVCSSCNAILSDDAKFCFNCGATFEVKAESQQEANAQTLSPKKANRGIVIGIMAVLIVAAILLGVILFSGQPYVDAIDNQVRILNGENLDFEPLMPSEYWDYMSDSNGTDRDYIIESYSGLYKFSTDYELKLRYGDDYEVSCKVLSDERVSDKTLAEFADKINSETGISTDLITDGYILRVNMVIEGSVSDRDFDIDCAVVKIDGEWYPCSTEGALMFLILRNGIR